MSGRERVKGSSFSFHVRCLPSPSVASVERDLTLVGCGGVNVLLRDRLMVCSGTSDGCHPSPYEQPSRPRVPGDPGQRRLPGPGHAPHPELGWAAVGGLQPLGNRRLLLVLPLPS